MAPATASSTTKMSGPSGHSVRDKKQDEIELIHSCFFFCAGVLIHTNVHSTWLFHHGQNGFVVVLVILEVHDAVTLVFVRAVHRVAVMEDCVMQRDKRVSRSNMSLRTCRIVTALSYSRRASRVFFYFNHITTNRKMTVSIKRLISQIRDRVKRLSPSFSITLTSSLQILLQLLSSKYRPR